jgi:hypothetical protein
MKKIILAILLIISSLSAFSQQATDIYPNVVTVPRYNNITTLNTAIPSPTIGMMAYLTSTNSIWYYSGFGGWKDFATPLSNINYSGNSDGFSVNATAGYSSILISGYQSALLRFATGSGSYQWQLRVSNTDGNNFGLFDMTNSAAERFTVKRIEGFVGLNVPNPLFRLDIDGRIRIRSNTYSAGLWFNDNTNSAQNTFLGIDPNNNFGIFSSALNANIFTAKMSNGYIGIGTETPNAPLQFANTGANRKIVLYETGNNDHQFYGLGINAGVLRYQVEQSASDHVFYAGAGTSTSNELFRIKGTGKVGIGTATPKSSLEVNGTLATKVSINIFSGNYILDESASVWIFTQANTVSFPDANSCENRRYVIVNRGSYSLNMGGLSKYINFSGYDGYSIPANSSIEIISDGTNWHQIK